MQLSKLPAAVDGRQSVKSLAASHSLLHRAPLVLGMPRTPLMSNPAAQQTSARARVISKGLANMEKAFFGENLGARDPTPGEVASNFSEKVLGNYNTDHIVKPPDAMKSLLGLSARTCKGNPATAVLPAEESDRLRQQVPGWRLCATKAGLQCIRQDWKLKDDASAEAFVALIQNLADEEEHPVSIIHDGVSTAVELTTAGAGGLTENDFILAAKMNQLNIADLLPKRKPRFWA